MMLYCMYILRDENEFYHMFIPPQIHLKEENIKQNELFPKKAFPNLHDRGFIQARSGQQTKVFWRVGVIRSVQRCRERKRPTEDGAWRMATGSSLLTSRFVLGELWK